MTNEYNDLWELDRPVLVTLVTELRAELSAAQAALTQAERELELTQSKLSNARGEASRLQALIERRRIEGDDTRANAAKWEEIALQFQRERDEARAELLVQDAISAMGAKWLVDLTSLRIKYERQRRTIRALVVAATCLNMERHQLATIDYFPGSSACWLASDESIRRVRKNVLHNRAVTGYPYSK